MDLVFFTAGRQLFGYIMSFSNYVFGVIALLPVVSHQEDLCVQDVAYLWV